MSENQPPEDVRPEDAQPQDAQPKEAQPQEAQPQEAEAAPEGEQPQVTASGSRWESSEPVPAAVSYPSAEAPTTVTQPDRSRWAGGKAALIGAGLGLALVAGLGGFAVGHATADGDDHGRFESERDWHEGGRGDSPMPREGGPGFDRGQRPDFGQPIDPDTGDSDQDDSSTQG